MQTKICKLWSQTCVSGFSIRNFVHNYTCNLKTIGHISMFYLSHNCFTIEVIYSLGQSCMWDTIGELWTQTHIATTFQYNSLCVLTLVTPKLQVACGHSTYPTTVLLPEMSIFCVRAGCEIWLTSYASKHTSESLSDKSFVHIQLCLRHITWKLHVIRGRSAYWTTPILLDTFFVWF